MIRRIYRTLYNYYLEAQLIKLGLYVIKNNDDFGTGVRKWFDRPRADRTWPTFKTNIRDARRSLQSIRGMTM